MAPRPAATGAVAKAPRPAAILPLAPSWRHGAHTFPASLPPLVCANCGQPQPPESRRYVCSCGGSLELGSPAPFSRALVDLNEPSIWRYRAALPLADVPRDVSLGEGLTPLAP